MSLKRYVRPFSKDYFKNASKLKTKMERDRDELWFCSGENGGCDWETIEDCKVCLNIPSLQLRSLAHAVWVPQPTHKLMDRCLLTTTTQLSWPTVAFSHPSPSYQSQSSLPSLVPMGFDGFDFLHLDTHIGQMGPMEHGKWKVRYFIGKGGRSNVEVFITIDPQEELIGPKIFVPT